VKTKLTAQQLKRVDAWFAFWNLPRKTMAAQMGVSIRTLMSAAQRNGGYVRIPRG
jgi:hypothetical protein